MAVELQLALALPTAIVTSPILTKGSLIDLNSFDSYSSDDFRSKMNKKRKSDEDSEADSSPRTLSLFLWNKQPKDDDDLPDCSKTCNLNLIQNGGETEGIVGWPPIRSYWKKQRGQDLAIGRSNRLFVKAQIEGVVITRKIDLRLYRSYHSLSSTLLFMFNRGHESVEEYNLTYQDNRGDWVLAVDVPWRTFIESVVRLKLTRKED